MGNAKGFPPKQEHLIHLLTFNTVHPTSNYYLMNKHVKTNFHGTHTGSGLPAFIKKLYLAVSLLFMGRKT